MDWLGFRNTGTSFMKKYRYAVLIIIAGILLLTVPNSEQPQKTTTISEVKAPPELKDSLAHILGMIDGAGKVEVLLTESRGEETVYQTDKDLSSGEHTTDQRLDTVLITGEGRLESGLVKQKNPPVYLGAVIVCQGAANPQVRLAVVEAVMSVTGLTSDKITVLKMK